MKNNGDVEQASDFFDAFIKKYGLEPVMGILNSLIDLIVEQIKGHQALVIVNALLDEFILKLEAILKMIDPVLAFRFFKK